MALWMTISLVGYACIIIAFALMLHWQKKDTSAKIKALEKRMRDLNQVGCELDLMTKQLTGVLGIKSPSEENRRHFSNMYSSKKRQ